MVMKKRGLMTTIPQQKAARLRQPMTRGEVHTLMSQALNTMLAAMNELEGRIQELEAQVSGERKTASGLLLPASMGDGRVQ